MLRFLPMLLGLCALVCGQKLEAWAAERDARLEVADEYAKKRMSRRDRAGLSAARLDQQPALLEQLELGQSKFVKPGQEWWLAVRLTTPELARMMAGTGTQPGTAEASLKYYQFKVQSVSGDQARIQVFVDGRQTFDVTLNSRWQVTAQQTPLGGNALGLPLDYFPVGLPVLPDPDDSSIRVARGSPTLPSGPSARESRPVSFSDRDALEFIGIDGFGREVKVAWRKGDPWPAYMSGPAGVAVLLQEAPQ